MTIGRRVVRACLLVLICVWTVVAQAQTFEVKTHTLNNGMKILVQEDHSIPNVALYIFYRIGSRNERPGTILEEGFSLSDLRRIADSMARAASIAGVTIVTGDTKVVERGSGDGVYITTTGIGIVPPGVTLSAAHARPGDAVLLSRRYRRSRDRDAQRT